MIRNIDNFTGERESVLCTVVVCANQGDYGAPERVGQTQGHEPSAFLEGYRFWQVGSKWDKFRCKLH